MLELEPKGAQATANLPAPAEGRTLERRRRGGRLAPRRGFASAGSASRRRSDSRHDRPVPLEFRFRGVVESVHDDVWVIANTKLRVPTEARSDEAEPGTMVVVDAIQEIPRGEITAIKIRALPMGKGFDIPSSSPPEMKRMRSLYRSV